MHKFSIKKAVAVGAAGVIVASGAGVAFAYWTSTGDGSGSATTGSDTPFSVSVDNLTGADLTPGGPINTVGFTVTNTSTGHQKVSAATVAIKNNDGTVWSSGTCTKDDFSITSIVPASGDLAQNGTASGSFKIQMVNSDSNQNDCKNVTVPLQVHVS